jgi:predicted transporter
MRRMRAAGRAELLDHEFLGLLLLVLAGRVIAPLAAVARQTYQISHRFLIASLLIGAGILVACRWAARGRPNSASPRRDSNP